MRDNRYAYFASALYSGFSGLGFHPYNIVLRLKIYRISSHGGKAVRERNSRSKGRFEKEGVENGLICCYPPALLNVILFGIIGFGWVSRKIPLIP